MTWLATLTHPLSPNASLRRERRRNTLKSHRHDRRRLGGADRAAWCCCAATIPTRASPSPSRAPRSRWQVAGPYMLNLRWVERPTLLSWIIAAISAPFGGREPVHGAAADRFVSARGLPAHLHPTAKTQRQRCGRAARRCAVPRLPAGDPLQRDDYRRPVAGGAALLRSSCGGPAISNARSVSAAGSRSALYTPCRTARDRNRWPIFALGISCRSLSRSWRQDPGLAMAGVICALPLAFWYAAIYTPGGRIDLGGVVGVRPRAVARASQYRLRHRDGDVAGSPDGRGLPRSRSLR